jgi:hypothetical protein
MAFSCLGKLPSEAAGTLLTHALVLVDRREDEDLMDWVAGDWAPLFAHKLGRMGRAKAKPIMVTTRCMRWMVVDGFR